MYTVFFFISFAWLITYCSNVYATQLVINRQLSMSRYLPLVDAHHISNECLQVENVLSSNV